MAIPKDLFIVLNKWQMKNKELVKAFKSEGWKVFKNKKVPKT